MQRRVLWLMTLWLVLAAALWGRLFVCMLLPDGPGGGAGRLWHQHLAVRAELEHLALRRTDDARGRILFRNGMQWSGGFPATIVGAVGLPDVWPDNHRAVAEQGRSGLEYTFDRLLSGRRPGYIGQLRDRDGHAVSAPWFHIPAISGADIRTTIDPGWQYIAQALLRHTGIRKCAIVVLDVDTDDALALASRGGPPGNIEAVRAETPGSIFKLVTAAAGLESFRIRPQSTYDCEGQLGLPGLHMRCWRTHGHESLHDALAASCDVALATVGIQEGRQSIEEMARRLRIGTPQVQTVTGHCVLTEAQPGTVFRRAGHDAGLLAHTAIGQEDVRLSPLQAANIVRTIAAGGRMQNVRLVVDAEMNGRAGRTFERGPSAPAMSAATARALGDAMRAAVVSVDGTGHVLSDQAPACAVKTGTAELGDTGRVNAWMAGYFPYAQPDIAFCVFVGDVTSSQGHEAVHQIVRGLLHAYVQFRSSSVIG